MKKHIELHYESSYSSKNIGSTITPRSLLEHIQKEGVNILGIVDYCNCSSIIAIERLKQKLNLSNLQIIYGISLNIKFADLYVPTIILAKNKKGVTGLFNIVTKLNEDNCYFINKSTLDKYKDNFILGISKFSLDKDYTEVIKYYTYIEISPSEDKNTIIQINEYAKQHNLLLIASNNPNALSKEDEVTKLFDSEVKPLFSKKGVIFDQRRYYLSEEELLTNFNFLPNANELVIDNCYQIASLIEDYNLDYSKTYKYHCSNESSLKKEVYERANLLYLDNIPLSVQNRLDSELSLIKEHELEGTIFLLENLIHRAKKDGYYAMVGSYFTHSLIAYLLGLTPLNPLDNNDNNSIINNYKQYGYKFEIFISQDYVSSLKIYLTRLLKTDYLYRRSNLLGFDTNEVEDILNNISSLNELEKGYILSEFKEIKRMNPSLPDTYLIIPSEKDLLDITPKDEIRHEQDNITCQLLSFGDLLKHNFITLRFRPTSDFTLISLLEKATNFYLEDIPLDDNKTLNNTYQIVKHNTPNDYPSYIHYNIVNNYEPTMKITTISNLNSLNDLINLSNDDVNWLPKVLRYYYLNYYRTYYEKQFYKIYLDKLISSFNLYKKISPDILEVFNNKYQKGQLNKITHNDATMELLLKTIKTMYDLHLQNEVKIIIDKYLKEKEI